MALPAMIGCRPMKISRTSFVTILAVAALLGFAGWRHFFHVQIVNAHPSGQAVIAFGDSLTSGVGAGPGEDYPAVLSALARVQVLNRGVPGETAGEALKRLDRDVLNQNPRIVIVCLGGNDILRRTPEDETFGALERIVSAIQDKGALVVLLGVEGPILSGSPGRRFRRLAREKGCVLVPDVLSGILTNAKLKSDQIHPNAAGYRIMAERVQKALQPYL
jgi:acyl-CoA thioesterase I